MSTSKIITLLITITLIGAGAYAFFKQRTVSPELSAYVQARYSNQLNEYEIDSVLLVDVFGENNIGVLQSKMNNFRYWISSTSYDQKYQVSKHHKAMLVGMSIYKDQGVYQVLLPRGADKLTMEQLRVYIDNVSQSQINYAKKKKIGMKS